MEGFWEFPGGKIEPNEAKEACIVREIKEELGATIRPIKYLGVSNYSYTNLDKPFSITLYGFLCELIEGELTLTEHVAKAWCTKEEIKKLKLAEADLAFIDLI